MRQLLSIRLVAALVALAALAWLVNVVILDDTDDVTVAAGASDSRSVDLVDVVVRATRSPEFGIDDDGTTSGLLDFTLSGDRVMRIAPGTVTDFECDQLFLRSRCAVFAELLGDAVLWVGVRPLEGDTVLMPEVLDLVDGEAVLANGWRIPFPPVIERECGDLDIVSFSDFLRRFSENSVSVVDVSTGEVVAVRCAPEVIEAARQSAADEN